MKKRKIIIATISVLSLAFIIPQITSAASGDLIQSISVGSDGSFSGFMMCHKTDNDNLTYWIRDDNGERQLVRNDTETRTDVNMEQTMGETYNYENIGVTGTVSGNATIYAKNSSGGVVCQSELIDRNSADNAITAVGTQCDVRDASGNRLSDFLHFKTGTTYEVYDVVSSSVNGVPVTLYGVLVESSSIRTNGLSFNNRGFVSPGTSGNSEVVYIFDSCGELKKSDKDKKKITKPYIYEEKPDDVKTGLKCGATAASLEIGQATKQASGCGETNISEDLSGTYRTSYNFKLASDAALKTAQSLIHQGYKCDGVTLNGVSSPLCDAGRCGVNIKVTANINTNMPKSPSENFATINGITGFKAGTYFNDYFASFNANINPPVITSATCPGNQDVSCRIENKGDCDYCNGRGSTQSECSEKGGTWVHPEFCYETIAGGQGECTTGKLQGQCESEVSTQNEDASVNLTGNVNYEADSNPVILRKTMSIGETYKYEPITAYVDKKTSDVYYGSCQSSDGPNGCVAYPTSRFINLMHETGKYIIDANIQEFSVTAYNKKILVVTGSKVCDPQVVKYIIDPPLPSGPKYIFMYRPIDVFNPFPNRAAGENWATWIQSDDNKRKLQQSFDSDKLNYEITLTPALINAIRDYNNKQDAEGGYLDESISIDGSSDFLNPNNQDKGNIIGSSGLFKVINPDPNYNLGCGPKNRDKVGCK